VIVSTGIYYAMALLGAAGILGWLLGPFYAIPLVILAAFCLYFFRDPEREIPSGPVAVSPADGKVVTVKGPALTRISIFLNVFDVHVNRTPIGGVIGKVHYQKGCFKVASREECSTVNEQNVVTVNGDGTSVVFKQIAGLIARRIVPFVNEGQSVAAGERIGMIRFGSRVDVYLPEGTSPLVAEGQTSLAGETVIADLSVQNPGHTYKVG
jgi:phosphatidylserine decarboxylase